MPNDLDFALDGTTAITVGQDDNGQGGVQCWDEEITESFTPDSATATRKIRCLWANRYDLKFALLKQYTVSGFSLTGMGYPDAPFMRAQQIDISGEGVRTLSASGMVGYQWAVLNVLHGVPGNTIVDTPDLRMSVQALALPKGGSGLKFVGGDPLPNSVTPIKRIPTAAFSKLIKGVISVPLDNILDVLGQVNSKPIFNRPKETVLFEGGTSHYRFGNTGITLFDLQLHYNYNPFGWNKLYDKTGTLRRVIWTQSPSKSLYDATDLNVLSPKTPTGGLNPIYTFGS